MFAIGFILSIYSTSVPRSINTLYKASFKHIKGVTLFDSHPMHFNETVKRRHHGFIQDREGVYQHLYGSAQAIEMDFTGS